MRLTPTRHLPRNLFTLSAAVQLLLLAWQPRPAAGQASGAPGHSVSSNRGTPFAATANYIPPPLYFEGTFPAGGLFSADSVAAADVNADGKLDLVVGVGSQSVHSPNGGVSVLLGNGDGTFQAPVTYSSGGLGSGTLALADLNGDGKPDAIVVNCDRILADCFSNSGGVAVLLGNGDGTFQDAVSYDSGGVDALSLAVADLDGDGTLDVVVTNNISGTVGILLGKGDGTLKPAVVYAAAKAVTKIVLGDINHDGFVDIVVIGASGAGVLLGNGNGTFRPVVTYSSAGNATSLAIGDVNGDGKPDLVVSNSIPSSEAVLLGKGDGTFAAPVTYPEAGFGLYSTALSDLNHDGHLDIVVVSSNGVTVFLGNGDGSFQPGTSYNCGSAGPASVTLADVDGSGRPDLLVANGQTDNIGVLLNRYGVPPTSTIVLPSSDPAPFFTSLTYTAEVAPQLGGLVTGSVQFVDGGAPVAIAPISRNQATYTTSYPYVFRAPPAHTITAIYLGDKNNAGSSSDPLTEYVGFFKTTTTLASSGTSAFVGQSVTFTANLTSSVGTHPDGESVSFLDGKTFLGMGTLAAGIATFTTSLLLPKPHQIEATYAGDPVYKPSFRWKLQVIQRYPTSTTVDSSLNPSRYRQAVVFTATVSASGSYIPTGQVRFFDGATSIGTATVNAGVATLSKSRLAVGTHSITAEYLGDEDDLRNTSPAVNQTVQ